MGTETANSSSERTGQIYDNYKQYLVFAGFSAVIPTGTQRLVYILPEIHVSQGPYMLTSHGSYRKIIPGKSIFGLLVTG